MSGVDEALRRLQGGNQRFMAAVASRDISHLNNYLDDGLAQEQRPIAVVVGCADSRVPAERVFDQGPGDLFVVRTAGNLVGPLQTGSIEFALLNFAPPLIVVLGHTQCGAVRSAIEGSPDGLPPALGAVVAAVQSNIGGESDLEAAIHANTRAVAGAIETSSGAVHDAVAGGAVRIVAAEYSIGNGEVSFFD